MSDYTLITKKIVSLTRDTKGFYFNVPLNLNYNAGQYITLLLNIDGKEIRRPYSLCSSPNLEHELCIAVKLIENGEATRYLHGNLKVGNEIKILKPNGKFILPKEIPKQLFFMAAGIGIGPILGLMKQALRQAQSDVTLVYSNSSKDDCIFYNELKNLETLFVKRLKIIWLFSDNKNLMLARLNRFKLEELVNQHIPNKTEVLFYTCGPFAYMEMIFITLLTMGFNHEQLFKETFTNYEEDDDDQGSLLTDKEALNYTDAEITIHINKLKHTFNLKAGETILQAAQKSGLELPYSCMRGMCSSCVCQLNSGSVHLHYNQILTDKELTNGRILTCTAHPSTPIIGLTLSD
jgi:ring-1,2-phenylacetyl-CoA epoxidase subunit PaaE